MLGAYSRPGLSPPAQPHSIATDEPNKKFLMLIFSLIAFLIYFTGTVVFQDSSDLLFAGLVGRQVDRHHVLVIRTPEIILTRPLVGLHIAYDQECSDHSER